MALTATELAQIVWSETRCLGPARLDPNSELNVLRRMIAQLAAATSGEGFSNFDPLPTPADVANSATAKQIANIADAAKDARGAQMRLLIWEAASDLSGPKLDTTPPPPDAWAKLTANETTQQFLATLPDGRRILALSRAAQVDDASAPFVNILTGAGLAAELQAGITPAPAPALAPPLASVSKFLQTALILGFLLFGAGGLMAAVAGLSVAGAHNVLSGQNPLYKAQLVARIVNRCFDDRVAGLPGDVGAQAPICATVFAQYGVADVAAFRAKAGERGFSVATLTTTRRLSPEDIKIADTVAACVASTGAIDLKTASDCKQLWRAAVDAYQTASGRTWYMDWLAAVSSWLVGPNPTEGSTSIVAPYLVSLAGVAITLGALGFITRKRVAGVWIDQRNRVSLARAQVTLWTAVLLSGYLTFVLFNVGYAAVLDSTSAWADYRPFPTMDWNYWAALGIATSSSILSALTLNTKDKLFEVAGATSDSAKARGNFFGANTSGLVKNDFPEQASITDLVLGEEEANKNIVDISRLQNVLVTISLVSAVFWQIVESASNIAMKQMLAATGPLVTNLPGLGATFTALMFASHAAYLTAKAHDKPGDGAKQ